MTESDQSDEEILVPSKQRHVEANQTSRRPINMNHYATKKSAAQSMIDVALLMANASQLKTVLSVGPQYDLYYALFVLLGLSMALQVGVGVLLILIAKEDVTDDEKQSRLETLNDAATILIFFTVATNVLITALGFQGQSNSSLSSVLGQLNVQVIKGI